MERDLGYHGAGTAPAIENPAAPKAGDTGGAAAMLKAKGRTWRSKHAINVRLTIPLLFVRCYLTIVGGKERRNPQRRVDERRKNPLVTGWNIAFLAVLGLITGLALFTVIQSAARFLLDNSGRV